MKTPSNEMKNDTNEAATKRIQFIFETNDTIRNTIGKCLNEKNYHISMEEFSFIREIIFRSYNQYILHNIDRQQYLSRMLSRRDDQTIDHFIIWFQYFLCESNPDWMNYQILLSQWTECIVYNQDLFSNIIKQMDMLIELWTKVAPKDSQRSTCFIKHIVGQCFRQGRNHCLNTLIY
jgi:hypothetical protein